MPLKTDFASVHSHHLRRLRITAQKLLQSLPSEKRDGLDVALAVFRDLTLDPKRSTNLSQQLLSRLQSMPAVVERLKSEPERVVADLQELRAARMSDRDVVDSTSCTLTSTP